VSRQIGEERVTAIALMRKFIAYQFTDTVSTSFRGGTSRMLRSDWLGRSNREEMILNTREEDSELIVSK